MIAFRRALLGIAVIGLTVYLAAFLALAINQRSFMYFPSGVAQSPVGVGLKTAHEIKLRTSDGETLRAWCIPPAKGRPFIIFFHGNGGNIGFSAGDFQRLTITGNGLLAVEYRGYPGSSGLPSETGLLRDGEAAYQTAMSLGIPDGRIVILGQSLGTGVAVALAANHRVGGLILDSPYSSTADIAAEKYWMFPVRLVMLDQFHSERRIAQVKAPVLMLHGAQDAVIPIRFGRRLFAATREPKEFIVVPNSGHLALGAEMPKVLEWIKNVANL